MPVNVDPSGKLPNFKIIGYVFRRAVIHAISAEKLTHINYAFALVSEEGEIVLTHEASPQHLAQLQALKAKNPNLKLLVSVGGWGGDNFSDAALTPESRTKFSLSAIELIKNYALDGIDLDWEYPGQAGPGIKYRPEDKQNFTLMLADLRTHVDALSDERGRTGTDRYTITIASADREYFDHTEMDKVHLYLDWINIMSYDFFGSLTDTTGHHAGLYGHPSSSARNASDAVDQHLAAGIPREKLVVGAAFYGRGWEGIDMDAETGVHGLFKPYAAYAGDYSYESLHKEYLGKEGFTRHWDEHARAPYLWNPETNTLISYDDAESLTEKANYVKEGGLGGIMYWEHSQDPDEILLDVIYRNLFSTNS